MTSWKFKQIDELTTCDIDGCQMSPCDGSVRASEVTGNLGQHLPWRSRFFINLCHNRVTVFPELGTGWRVELGENGEAAFFSNGKWKEQLVREYGKGAVEVTANGKRHV